MLERSSDATEKDDCPVVLGLGVSLVRVVVDVVLLIFCLLRGGPTCWVATLINTLEGVDTILHRRRDDGCSRERVCGMWVRWNESR
jgi:hypothetical protein